ncbi:hypothetical protein [Gulosibacter sp. 10]|uniref:phage tail tube protein n=1 Tax=Gulosibacter sp. 10 TaxID=1255570 RepID=UPI00097E8B2C|nr:hypothetical protein [Gulosibacter sp. 10]SJM61391.1 hypothetical protein FM112_07845 [Gulosibacter sp. 10]
MAIKKNQQYNEGFIADGNLVVMAVAADEVEDPTQVSAALLNGATALDVTYDITPDGWNHTPQNETSEGRRLTSPFTIQREGRQTDTLEVTYVWNPELPEGDTSLDRFLTVGERYIFFTRWGIDHDQDFAAGDIVDLFPVKCGRKRKNQPAEGEDHTKTVTLSTAGLVREDVALVAGPTP